MNQRRGKSKHSRPVKSRRLRRWAGVGIVLIATAVLYLPALDNGFTNWDDDRQVVANPAIRDLSPEGLKSIFSSFTVSLYQPLTSLVFAVQYRFFELDPRIYHAVNVLLHLANILLVYVLVRSLSQRTAIALIVASAVRGCWPTHAYDYGVTVTVTKPVSTAPV